MSIDDRSTGSFAAMLSCQEEENDNAAITQNAVDCPEHIICTHTTNAHCGDMYGAPAHMVTVKLA